MAAESQTRKRKTNNGENHQPKKRRDNDENNASASNTSQEGSQEESQEPTAGKIKHVAVKNFMCHDNFQVRLNDRINFIVGANGSGKSAILTALTVGLGARATATNRGPSVKQFIKKGKNSCHVEVTISNEGVMAYKPEIFGDEIKVIRTITLNTSTYRVKDHTGHTVTTRKEDLENILNFLNIQVDNPISVLNQDASRTFLASSEPEKKYTLFMRATRLDLIGENYKAAIRTSEEAKARLEEANKHLHATEKEIQQLKKKLNALESLDRTIAERETLLQNLSWAYVIQEEKKLLTIDHRIKDQQKVIEELQQDETNKIAKEQQIEAQIEDLKKQMAQMEAEAQEGAAKLTESREKYMEAKNAHDQRKKQMNDLKKSINLKETDITTLQNAIKTIERESGAADVKRQEANQTITQNEQQIDEVEATLRTKQTDLMHLEENKRRTENESLQLKNNVTMKTTSLGTLKQRLKGFKSQANDASSVYGANIPRLLKRIEEAHSKGRFKRKPVGPLGSYIKMRDPTWIPAVENHLGWGTLSTFCVDNSHDAKILNTIMKEVFHGQHPPNVTISKFFDQVHNVSRGCTRSTQYLNLLDAMEISHPVVANCLIDQRSIETCLLIPTSQEASAVMKDECNVPVNTGRAITKQADLFYPDPGYRSYGGSVTRPRFLQVSTTQAIQDLEEEIGVAEEELQIAKQDLRAVLDRVKINAEEMQQVNQQVRTLKTKLQELKSGIEDAKETIAQLNDDTVNAYLTEIEELQKLVMSKKEELAHMADEDRQSFKETEAKRNDYKKQADLAQNLETRLIPLKDQKRELIDEKNRLNLSNKGTNRRIEDAKQKLQQFSGEHQQQQRVVNAKVEVAEAGCPRVIPKMSIDQIQNKASELLIMINTTQSQHGSKELIERQLEEKVQHYEGLHSFAKELEDSNGKQLERVARRREEYKTLKKEIGESVRNTFINILSLRNYTGNITIDYKNKKLFIEVAPKNDARKLNNDAKTLSGGERSYSTVSFIMALWECTGLPFYFLDEFDVFMDKVNRRTVLDILLDFAKIHPNSQFTFLTPLETSHITAGDTISIWRLDPPARSR